MDNKFRIQIMSDYDYEDLVSLVYYNEVELFLLTQEDGFDLLRICFFSPENNKFWKLNIDEFMFILEKSKYRLNEFNDTSSTKKIVKENYVPEIVETAFEYSKVSDNLSPQVNIYINQHLMSSIVRNEYSSKNDILIYPNLEKEQDGISIQWNVLYDKFVEIIKHANLEVQ